MEGNSQEFFHSLFNKINNICVVAGANKKILEEELAKSSSAELKEKLSRLVEVFSRIEENARTLDEKLKLLYRSSQAID